MKLVKHCILSSLLFLTQTVFAEGNLTSSFLVQSDYVYRGITRTDHGPSVMGDLHYDFDFGFGFGSSAANVGSDEAHSMESRSDVYYVLRLHPNIALKARTEFFFNYHLTQAQTWDYQFSLLLFGDLIELTGAYSPKFLGRATAMRYVQLASSIPLLFSEKLSLDLSTGYNSFKDELQAGSTSYVDYRVALSKQHQNHQISLFWVGTNRRIIDGVSVDEPAKDESFGAQYAIHL